MHQTACSVPRFCTSACSRQHCGQYLNRLGLLCVLVDLCRISQAFSLTCSQMVNYCAQLVQTCLPCSNPKNKLTFTQLSALGQTSKGLVIIMTARIGGEWLFVGRCVAATKHASVPAYSVFGWLCVTLRNGLWNVGRHLNRLIFLLLLFFLVQVA